MDSVSNLTNVSKHNPYNSWDRGLFLIERDGQKKFAKINSIDLVTKGTLNSPAVIQYSVRIYNEEPKNLNDVTTKSFQTISGFRTLVRNVIDDVIVLEGFAIRHFKSHEQAALSNEQIEEAFRQGFDIAHKVLTDLTDLETVVGFGVVNGLLTRTSGTVSFVMKRDGVERRGTITQFSGQIDPLSAVAEYIRNRINRPQL